MESLKLDKTLQAVIFKTSETALNGQTMTVDGMTEAVIAFNANFHSGLIVFDEYPSKPHGTIDLSRVVGTSTLEMDSEFVIATVVLNGKHCTNIIRYSGITGVSGYIRSADTKWLEIRNSPPHHPKPRNDIWTADTAEASAKLGQRNRILAEV